MKLMKMQATNYDNIFKYIRYLINWNYYEMWFKRYNFFALRKVTLAIAYLLISFTNPFAMGKVPEPGKTIQKQLYQKNHFEIVLSFGPSIANRVCQPCYEEKQIYGTNLNVTIGYTVIDRLKIKLEAGSFSEKWQVFHNETSEKSNSYNNSRNFLVASLACYPFRVPAWFGAGIGIGNYKFTPEEPLLTAQQTYTLSTINNQGPVIQGGIGYDYLLGKKLQTGIKITPSYLFLNDLKFTSGETIKNQKGSFVISATISFGLRLPAMTKQQPSSQQ